MTEQPNGRMAEWPNDRMAEWPNDQKLAERPKADRKPNAGRTAEN